MKGITEFIIAFVGGLIPELTLCYIVMKLTGEGWSIFVITYIAILLFYLIVWFFRSIVGWISFIVYHKKQMVKGIYEELINHRYPIENYNVYDKAYIREYFEDIVYEPQLQAETRIHAGSVCTQFNVLLDMGKIQGFFRVRKATFEALNKYFSAKDPRIDPQNPIDFSKIKNAKDIVYEPKGRKKKLKQ